MPGIKIADITSNTVTDALIGGALLPMSLNGQSFSVKVNDFFYPNVINAERLAANAINANHITSETVISRHIQGNAITAEKIKAGSVTAREISAETINSIKISAAQINVNNIIAGVLNALVINTDNLAANAINADKIKTNSIQAKHIQASSITTSSLRANAITAGKIKAGTVTAREIAACSVAATNLQSGAIEARALAANIIMTGSLQSRNFDGFVRNASTDGQDILGYLDAGEKGFFMDDQNGLIVCTDLIARNNIITSNLINFSLTASSLEEVIGDNGEKSIQVSLDDNTLARDPESGKITISSKLVNTQGFFDKSLLLDPNTIFFGMSERQEFKLPTIGVGRAPMAIYVGPGNGNMNPNANFPGRGNNPFNIGLSATYFAHPRLANRDNDGIYIYRRSDRIGGAKTDSGGPSRRPDVLMYHPDDNRIHNLPFLGNETFRRTNRKPMQDVNDGDAGFYGEPAAYAQRGLPVLFALDLVNYVDGESVDKIIGDIQLNNLKIKIDTSKYNHINDVVKYQWHRIRTQFVASTATAANMYGGSFFGAQISNKVRNPTILRDVYEYTEDVKLGSIDKGNLTRYMISYYEDSNSEHTRNFSYPGYISLSAVFDTDTNLRFNVAGVVPSTTRYDLSTVNCLVPQNYHPDNKEAAYDNPSQQKVLVSLAPTTDHDNRMMWEHNWYSDEPSMEGFPEIDPDRINPGNGLRGFDSVAATIQHFGAEPGDKAINEIITDRNKPDQNLDRPD